MLHIFFVGFLVFPIYKLHVLSFFFSCNIHYNIYLINQSLFFFHVPNKITLILFNASFLFWHKKAVEKVLSNDKSFIYSYYILTIFFPIPYTLIHFFYTLKKYSKQQEHNKISLNLISFLKNIETYKRNNVDNNKDTIHKRGMENSPTKQPTCFTLFFCVCRALNGFIK